MQSQLAGSLVHLTTSVSRFGRGSSRSRRAGPRHCGRLHGERDEVLRLEVVHVRLPAGARERLGLERQHAQVVGNLATAEHRVEASRELVVLRRDADGVPPRLAVVVVAGGVPICRY